MNWDNYALIFHRPLGDRGEDSYGYSFERFDFHALAVFDGCGGSGAWKYPEFDNATGAFVAAHTTAPKFLDWFDSLDADAVNDPAALAENLRAYTSDVLTGLKEYCSTMGIVGGLVKSFPCTAACALVTDSPTGGIRLTALNAGDSRVYCLTPAEGLVQVTHDDSRGNPDPLDALRSNPPLSAMLNADKPYCFTATQLDLASPCAVLSASDGIFGFVRSPMDFEYMLLDALMRSDSIHGFEENFQQAVTRVTGDDSTCVMSFYGFNGYEAIRRKMTPRYEMIRALVQRLDAIPDAAERDAEMRRVWEDYRKQTLYYEKVG